MLFKIKKIENKNIIYVLNVIFFLSIYFFFLQLSDVIWNWVILFKNTFLILCGLPVNNEFLTAWISLPNDTKFIFQICTFAFLLSIIFVILLSILDSKRMIKENINHIEKFKKNTMFFMTIILLSIWLIIAIPIYIIALIFNPKN